MIRGKIIYAILLCLLVSTLFFGCAEEESTGPSDDTIDDGNTIKVGLLVPYSGECAAYGSSIARAVQLAVNEINDAGGVLDKEIIVVKRDSKTDPLHSFLVARELVQDDGVIAIFGGENSDVSMEIYDAVNDMEVLQISGSAPVTILSGEEDYFFRTSPDVRNEANTMANYMLNELADSNARVIFVNDSCGNLFRKWFCDFRFRSPYGKTLRTVNFESGKTSYAAEIESLFAPVPPEIDSLPTYGGDTTIILYAYPQSGAQIIRDWKASGYEGKWILCSGLKAEEFIISAGTENVEGLQGFAPFSGEIAYEYFKDEYEEYWNEDPRLHRNTEHWYDAMILFAYAILQMGTTHPESLWAESWLEAMEAVSNLPGEEITVGQFAMGKRNIERGDTIFYTGAAGPIEIDEYGDFDADIKFEVWEIHDGAFLHIDEVVGF